MNLTTHERNNISVLLVDSDNLFRTIMRDLLLNMGIKQVSSTTSHQKALTKIQDQHISHVIFTTQKTDMSAKDFVKASMETDDALIMIASASNPTTDGVFELLQSGARGFLVKPVQADSLESTLITVSKTKQVPDFILEAKDRNQAFALMVLNSLDQLSTILRQARQFETARHAIPEAMNRFRQSVEISKQFCEGGDKKLQEAIIERLETASSEPATRLGKLRKRRRQSRGSEPEEKELDSRSTAQSH